MPSAELKCAAVHTWVRLVAVRTKKLKSCLKNSNPGQHVLPRRRQRGGGDSHVSINKALLNHESILANGQISKQF